MFPVEDATEFLATLSTMPVSLSTIGSYLAHYFRLVTFFAAVPCTYTSNVDWIYPYVIMALSYVHWVIRTWTGFIRTMSIRGLKLNRIY